MQTDQMNVPTKDRERLGAVQVIPRALHDDTVALDALEASLTIQVRRYAAEHGYLVEDDTWTVQHDFAQVTWPEPDDPHQQPEHRPTTMDDPAWNMAQVVVQAYGTRRPA